MRPIWKCTLTGSDRAGWAVSIPASLADHFPAGSTFIIALGNAEVEWQVPPSFHDQAPGNRKCRQIVKSEIRDWLTSKGLTQPTGSVLAVLAGEGRVRLATELKEVRRHDNEDTERFYLDHFLDTMELKPDSIERGADPPDFIVEIDGDLYFVEMTEFHSNAKDALGRPRRAVEEDWANIQSMISDELPKRAGMNEVSARVCFNQVLVPPKTKHKQFVHELVDFVEAKVPVLTQEDKEFDDFPTGSLLEECLEKVEVSRLEGLYISLWEWNRTSGSVGLREQELLDCIQDKLLLGRLSDAHEFWLIVVSGHRLSQSMGPRPQVAAFALVTQQLASSSYDRAYIYQYMYDGIWQWARGSGWTKVIPDVFERRRR